MYKYRITVENIGPGADWDENNVIECDGFALVGDKGKEETSIIHDLSVAELAADFAGDDSMFTAACIARAIREAVNLPQSPSAPKGIEALIRALAGGN